MNIRNFASFLVSLLIIFYLLFLGKSFLIPLAIAIVVWYLIISITSLYESLLPNNYRFNHTIAVFLSISSILIVSGLLTALLNSNINNAINKIPFYQSKFQTLISHIMNTLHMDSSQGVNTIFKSVDLSALIFNITNVFTNVAGYTTLIIVFAIFLLMEYHQINNKLKLIFKSPETYQKFFTTIENINQDITTYIKIKTLTSLLAGFLGFLVLFFLRIDLAIFWALLMFLLNYIPAVGPIVAIFFPIMVSLIQFDSLSPFIMTLISLSFIQLIIGNIIEPKLMGDSLNLSPLVIILSLAVWGSIWGIVGMFLCIPIMVITNIILSKFSKTRSLAIMLSARGSIE